MIQLPIGIDDFSKVSSYYYVDKTLFIKDILDYCQYRTILFTKPRRFGKSLNLSMIEYYFSNHLNGSSLFQDLAIASCGEKYLSHQGRYPVIHLNFKDISANCFEDFCADVINEISRVFRNFPELLDAKTMFDVEKKEFMAIANRESKSLSGYADALRSLTELLYRHCDKTPCIVLVDEYDTPLSIAYQNGYFEEAIAFFRKFYSSFSKSNPYVFFVLLTGITEISKESIFSEMNNVDVYTVADKEFSQYFGFTEAEVQTMFASFGMTPDMKLLKQWYGGYGADGSLLNPWSTLNMLNRGAYEPYWINTGSNFAIHQVLGDDPNLLQELGAMLNVKEIPFDFFRGISYRDLSSNKNILFSLLVHAGYLSFIKNEDGTNMLSLPNQEAATAFEREILSRAEKNVIPFAKARQLREAVESRDEAKIQSIFEAMIDASFSYLDLTKEKEYQSMVVALLAILFGEYCVKSEVVGRYGRCDVLLSPNKRNGVGIVVEIKKHKARLSNSKFEASAVAALKQIRKHRYYQELQAKGVAPIFLYAFVFDGFKMRAKAETINND